MNNVFLSFKNWWQESSFLKIMFIGFIVLLLQIPVAMIDDQVSDREWTKENAFEEVSQKWGRQQTIQGPRLVIPYYSVSKWQNKNGKTVESRKKKYASFLAEELTIDANIKNHIRYRGLYKIPLYQTTINMEGTFSSPDFSRWGISEQDILWNEAELAIGITHPGTIQKIIKVNWNGKEYNVEPGMGEENINNPGFFTRLGGNVKKKNHHFHINLEFNGSKSLYIAPMSKNTLIQMTSDWPDPSFQGYRLPSQHNINPKGFNAQWQIPAISLGYPLQWLNNKFDDSKLEHSIVGVDFISPIDNYRLTERSTKYAFMFLLFTFGVIWIFELISKVRVHIIQYLFIGLGMCMFYLLLLAFSEHIGFLSAYFVAGGLIVVMVTGYTINTLRSYKRGSIIGLIVTGLYAYLYTLLQEQSYALLFGSLGTFIALAVVMFLTRNINWFSNETSESRSFLGNKNQ